VAHVFDKTNELLPIIAMHEQRPRHRRPDQLHGGKNATCEYEKKSWT